MVIGIVAGAVSVAARVREMMVWTVEREVPVTVTKEAVTGMVLISSVAEDAGLPGMAVTVVAKPPGGVLIAIELAARMVVGAGVL